MNKINNYINHIVFLLDGSGSMTHLANDVVKIFDNQVKYLAKRSEELDQETRVSIYVFGNGQVNCLVYDKDVLRLPSLKSLYFTAGNTPLIDGTLKAISDLYKTATLYGDHSFLIYSLTDGEENASAHSSSDIAVTLKKLPDNWTIAVFVPDQTGVHEAKKFGFPAENISVWDSTSAKGLEEAGKAIETTTETYFLGRAKGIRGTKSLFKMKEHINAGLVKNNLKELDPSQYVLLPVHKDAKIKDYIESWLKTPYRIGSGFYMLNKKETIQAYKQIAIQDKFNGRIYVGASARKMLGLPDYEVKVEPASFSKFDIFVQSTSVNRNLQRGTKVIVMN